MSELLSDTPKTDVLCTVPRHKFGTATPPHDSGKVTVNPTSLFINLYLCNKPSCLAPAKPLLCNEGNIYLQCKCRYAWESTKWRLLGLYIALHIQQINSICKINNMIRRIMPCGHGHAPRCSLRNNTRCRIKDNIRHFTDLPGHRGYQSWGCQTPSPYSTFAVQRYVQQLLQRRWPTARMFALLSWHIMNIIMLLILYDMQKVMSNPGYKKGSVPHPTIREHAFSRFPSTSTILSVQCISLQGRSNDIHCSTHRRHATPK